MILGYRGLTLALWSPDRPGMDPVLMPWLLFWGSGDDDTGQQAGHVP